METEIVKAEDVLNDEERKAYETYVRSGRPELAVSTSLRLYELFLRGMSCQEIANLNPALGLGPVVLARVKHKWDERRDAYIAELMTQTGDIVKQSAAETAQLISLALSVAHKRHGEKLKKYLSTGDERELGAFNIESIKQMKDVIEMLMKLTGQENKKSVQLSGVVETKDVTPGGPVRLTPEIAGEILKRLAEK